MRVVKILGVGTYLPGPPINHSALSTIFGMSSEWLDCFIGHQSRHFCTDLNTGEVKFSLRDLCTYAAEKAIHQSGVERNSIDALVLATATPDHLMPSTVNEVADQLGLNQVGTYQIQSGCIGGVQALDLATQLIKSGRYRTVLVMGGENCQAFLNLRSDPSSLKSSELVHYALFGDGAGASILRGEDEGSGVKIGAVVNQFVGLGEKPGQVIRWLGLKPNKPGASLIFEDYKAIEHKVPVLTQHLFTNLLKELGCGREAIDYFMLPQLSRIMSHKIADLLQIPSEKNITCIERTANVGNALAFFQLELLFEQLKSGQQALLLSIESSKWLEAGMVIYA